MANLTANTKNYGQITLNTKTPFKPSKIPCNFLKSCREIGQSPRAGKYVKKLEIF